MRRICSSLAVVLLVLPASLRAGRLADRVPADAIIYAGWEGTDSIAARYGDTRLKAFLDASNLPALVNDFLPRLLDRLAADRPRDAENIRALLTVVTPMLRYPTAVYFAGIDVPPGGGPPRVKLAFMCRAGRDADAVSATFTRLAASIRSRPFPVEAFRVGDIAGIAMGYEQGLSAAVQDEPGRPTSLAAASDNFRRTAAKVGKDPVAMLYVDVEGLVRLADQVLTLAPDPQVQQTWPKVRDALGLNGLKRLAITGGFDGRDWSVQAFLWAPTPRSGLAALVDARPLSDQILSAIPATATVAAAARLSPGRILAEVRDGLGKVDPDLQKVFDGGMAQVNGALGFDLQKDLLEALGDEWAFYIDPNNTGNSALGAVFMNRLAKPEAAQAALGQLQKTIEALAAPAMARDKMQLRFARVDYAGTVINYAALPVVAPAWAVKDGTLYMGLYPQVVAGALDNAGARGKSLLENPDFQALRNRLGGQNCTGFSFSDLPRSVGDGYPMMLLVAQLIGIADMAGVNTPPMILPPLSRLRPLMTPAGGFSRVDDDGWHFKSISPFPCAGALASPVAAMGTSAMAMGLAVALPAVHSARARAVQVSCASNLRQIGVAAIMYSNENNGRLPPDLGALSPYANAMQVFFCPGDGDRPLAAPPPDQARQAAWIRQNSDYVYLGAGLRIADIVRPAEFIIAHDKIENHGGRGVNALFADGHVEWMATEDFKAAMQRQAELRGRK